MYKFRSEIWVNVDPTTFTTEIIFAPFVLALFIAFMVSKVSPDWETEMMIAFSSTIFSILDHSAATQGITTLFARLIKL